MYAYPFVGGGGWGPCGICCGTRFELVLREAFLDEGRDPG